MSDVVIRSFRAEFKICRSNRHNNVILFDQNLDILFQINFYKNSNFMTFDLARSAPQILVMEKGALRFGTGNGEKKN